MIRIFVEPVGAAFFNGFRMLTPGRVSMPRFVFPVLFLLSLAACTATPVQPDRVVGPLPVPESAGPLLIPKTWDAPRGKPLPPARVAKPSGKSSSPAAGLDSPGGRAEPGQRAIIGRLYTPPDSVIVPSRPAPESPKKSVPPAAPRDEDARIESEGDTRIKKGGGPQIPIVLNAQVRWFIRYYTGPSRVTFAKWLERSTRYVDFMRRIMREEGVPEDLVYIALIESGFNSRAYSMAGASGIWQFMRPTARRYGLKINWWIDEHRDPVKATRAAARYFKDLHKKFRSWHLAQAGYNAGEGKIRRGLNRLKRKDFWTLAKTRLIARETRSFVPKFVAARILAKNPKAYGFTGLKYEPPLRFEEVPVTQPTDLRWIASAAGVSMNIIRSLNPELRRWKTPPGYPGYKIKVPPGVSQKVAKAIADWKPSLYAGKIYEVRKGDTLGEIARNLGTTIEALAEANGLSNPGRLAIGQRLILPEKNPKSAKARTGKLSAGAKSENPAAGPAGAHVVLSGESIWDISRRYGVSVVNLLSWNRLSKDALIMPGDKIALSSKK